MALPSPARPRSRRLLHHLLRAGLGALLGLTWLIALGLYRLVPGSFALAAGVGVTAAFAVVHVIARRPSRWDTARLGWSRGTGRWVLLLVPVGVVLSMAKVVVSLAVSGAPADASETAVSLTWAVLVVVSFPLVEEVSFRTWIQRPAEQALGPALGIVTVALLFAAFHGSSSPFAFGSRVVGGLCYGALAWSTRSVWPAVALHAAENGWIALLNTVPALREAGNALVASPPAGAVPIAVAGYVAGLVAVAAVVRHAARGSGGQGPVGGGRS